MIEQTLKTLISDQLGVDADKIKLTDQILADLGGDSLDLVELLLAIEDKFDIELDKSEEDLTVTVGHLLEAITEKTNKG